MLTNAGTAPTDTVLKFSQPCIAAGTATFAVAKEDTGSKYFSHHSKVSTVRSFKTCDDGTVQAKSNADEKIRQKRQANLTEEWCRMTTLLVLQDCPKPVVFQQAVIFHLRPSVNSLQFGRSCPFTLASLSPFSKRFTSSLRAPWTAQCARLTRNTRHFLT